MQAGLQCEYKHVSDETCQAAFEVRPACAAGVATAADNALGAGRVPGLCVAALPPFSRAYVQSIFS